MGCTSYPEFDVDEEEDLVQCADKALHSAKETNHNRVIVLSGTQK